MNFFLKRWLSDSASAHVPARPRKLGIENLEDRTVPAITIPDVNVVQGPVQTGAVSEVANNQYDPHTVLNPISPNQIVTVATRVLFDAAGNPNGTALAISTSTDRGQTWSAQAPNVNPLRDPLSFNGAFLNPFTDVDSPSVAFDRANNIYVAYIQRNLANTSGALVVDKFTIDAFGNVTNTGAQRVLYRYVNQDPIFNPVIGVNNLLPTFTDPVSGQVNTNFAAGRGVYVAWNTAATQTGFGNVLQQSLTPSVIMMVVSDDGANSFSTPQFVSDNGFQIGDAANFRTTSVDPQIYFTHNSVTNAIAGGRLGLSWQTGITQAGTPASVTANTLTTDVSDPLNGNLATPLTVQQTTPNVTRTITSAAPNAAGTLQPGTTTVTQTVTINAANFTTLADLNVTISVFSQDLSQMSITLTGPTGPPITLLRARQFLAGGSLVTAGAYADGSLPGLPGGGVGGLGEQVYALGNNQWFHTPADLNSVGPTGLVFDQQAARLVSDPNNLAPYIMNLRPEDFTGGLDRFNGLTAGQLSGTWTLTIVQNKQDDNSTPPITSPRLDQWRMTFVSRVNASGYAGDSYDGVIDLAAGTATPNNPFAPTTATNVGALSIASPTTGMQGWYSVAVDNTSGAFSPFQGRVYVAYTAPGGGANDRDIFLVHSDDGGATWSLRNRVNDDFSTDDFSEDNRATFQPEVTVDPTTGTVVVMWYDARWDASNGRAATFMATSVDGGDTFSPNMYLNFTKSALDAIDRKTVKTEPVPNNLAVLTTRGNGFGNGQGLVAYGGTVVPVWTGNANQAPVVNPNNPFSGARLLTTVTRIAAGPRVLQGDMGPVSDSFLSPGTGATTYNDTVSIDGTRQLNAFYVRFDRRVDPATFTAADVQLRYRDTTGAAAQDISNQVLSVVPLDTNTYGATRFLIRISPQTRVGTYSYAVGTAINDRIRHDGQLGNVMDQNANGTPGEAADAFSNPSPAGGVPFTLPYTVESLPLIIPGPRVVSTTPGYTIDGAASFLDVTFDRDMLASSFTAARVLEVRTPLGVNIGGPFTVTANPPGTNPFLAQRVFRVTFPPQSLTGNYSLLLGPGIQSATGLAMDPNMNAGVELVTGRVTNPLVAGTVSVDLNTGFIGVAVPAAVDASTPGVATATLTVADAFFLTQALSTPIQLRLDITVPDTRKLSAQLIAPDGTVIQLFTGPGRDIAPFANFAGTVLNDFAPTANLIQNQGAPFTGGPYLPKQPLSVLNGKLSSGTWRLVVTNTSLTDAAQINSWGLSLPKPVLGSGLGEPVIDNTTLGFRVFTANPNQVVSTTTWTPVGPTQSTDRATGEQTNGVVTVTAVDPSDPSGNTVYAGGANGGLWKTSNFLTLDAAGPTWIPLLDAASAKAMHISSIAIIPRNNDPTQQSIVLVGTGDPATQTPGVGMLRSLDGGQTFRLIDSRVNADPQTNVLPVDSTDRDHVFSLNNTYVYKVAVDPVRQTNGEFYMYAAIGGDPAAAGLWRSENSGRTWVRQKAGECTDIVLASNRVDLDPVSGTPRLRNADAAYAAFATSAAPGAAAGGVYFTQNVIGTTPIRLDLAVGATGKPLFSNGLTNISVGNLGTNPNNNPTRILLAVVNAPAANDPNGTRVYQGWVYALVIGGGAPGLYMTKDFGANWVLVHTQMQTALNATGQPVQTHVLTNDETEPLFDLGTTPPTGLPRWNSLVVDPTDPNVVYIGASNVLTTANGTESSSLNAAGVRYSDGGVFRVDVSTVNDAHAQVARDDSAGGVGTQVEAASTGGLVGGPTGYNQTTFDSYATNPLIPTPYFNRLRDPNNPFVTGATQIIAGSQFTNTGSNAQVSRFRGVSGDALIRNIQTIFDPLTRKTRLLISTDRGVYTAVDGADPLPTQGIYANAVLDTAIGSATVVTGNRSSNLALADATSTALQPSLLSADLAGLYNQKLFDPFGNPLPPAQQNSVPGQWIYTVTDQGYLNAPGGIIAPSNADYGAQLWTGEVTTDAYLSYQGLVPSSGQWRYTGQVEADPQGLGYIYQYRPAPYGLTAGGAQVDSPGNTTDVFFVTLPGQAPIGRSNGLFNIGLGDTQVTGIWATTKSAVFGVNPGDNQGIVISSPIGGRVFLTTDQGLNWFTIGTQAQFNNSPGTALAFGGRAPNAGVNDFIYNGTAAGKIWVTLNAGGTWRDISAGIPATAGPILKIIPNPRVDTYEAYAITARGVYYKADARTAGAWTDITGNLFSITRNVFGEATVNPLLFSQGQGLSALAVDWRYAQPVLYVGGDTGVYRTLDGGTAWELFPAMTGGAPTDGGYLPTVKVTDLDLAYGNLNPTGVPDQATARNILVASTYGRGLFAIRLNPADVPAGLGTSGPWVNTTNTPPVVVPPNVVTGVASITVTFGDPANAVVNSRVFQRVDPATLNPANMAVQAPNGALIPFTVTDVSAVSATTGVSDSNKFRVDFTPTLTGNYLLLMNLGVRDTSGRRMNQNQNGLNGETPQDYFISGQYPFTVNQPPAITGIANQGLVVGVPSAALAFTVGDVETPAGTLAVSVTSSNTTVLPLANIAFGGGGANRTVTVTPQAVGTSVVTLTVTDGGGRTTSTSFTVSASPVPALPFSDNFNRPDAPDLGGQWVLRTGTAAGSFFSVLGTSPVALATVNGVSHQNTVTQATVSLAPNALNSSSSLVARYSGAAATATMYVGGVVLQGGVVTARIVSQVNGAATELVRSAPIPVAPQYILRFEVVNDSLKLFVNGVLVAYTYDTTPALAGAGGTGIRLTSGNRIDDFSDADIVLTAPAALPAIPASTAPDTFTQASGTQLSRDWRDRIGNLSVTGNRAVGQAAGANLSTYNLVAPTANAGAEAVVSFTAAGQSSGVVLRYTGAPGAADTNMYLGLLSSLGGGQQQANIMRNVAGTWTALATVNFAGNGGRLRFEANGPSLKLFVDDARVLTAYDTVLTAGGVGLRTNQGGTADDFTAFALGTNAALTFNDPFTASPPRNQLASTWTERAGAIGVAANVARGTNVGANLATLNGVSATDVVVSAVVQPPAGGVLAAGLVARYTGTGDLGSPTASFYWGALSILTAADTAYTAQIWRIANGAATLLNYNVNPITPAFAAGKTLRFEVLGASLKLYLNDVLVSFGTDGVLAGAGSVGVRLGLGAGVDDFSAAVPAQAAPAVPGFADNFNASNAQGSLSTNWQERSGFFNVTAGTPRAVGGAAGQPNLAALNGVSVANTTVDASFFFTAAGQTAGLVGRYGGTFGTGDSNYYLATFTTAANGDAQVSIQRNVNGTLATLATTTLVGYFNPANFAGINPAFRFVLNGTQLRLFVDNVQRLSVNDGTFTTGSVGMRTTQGAGVDNFTTS